MLQAGLKPLPVPRRQPTVPCLSAIERKAYQAAWRIVNDHPPQTLNDLASAASRRSRHVDWLASRCPMSQQTQERNTPQFEQRVASAMDALRAGEDREELMHSHGRIVVKEAEKRLG